MRIHRLALCLLFGASTLPSHAVGRLIDVDVRDRDTGAVLPVHYHRGEYWVAGTPGSRYAVVLRNRLGERLLAVTAVDGVNVLSGETAGWEQSGYVLSPSQLYQVIGWRKSGSEVASFVFSGLDGSYAARTGRPDHVGVIGVAVFREQQPEPVARWPQPMATPPADNRSWLEGERGAGAPQAPPESAARLGEALSERRIAPAAPGAEADAASDRAAVQSKALPAPTPRLGTAHGQRESSWVTHTTFARRHARPDEIIRIRYDSRENLIASGVIPLPAAPRVDPFPASAQSGYVPDPPVQRY